jgi:glycosyltransferase involved in cell wall biosynthesis
MDSRVRREAATLAAAGYAVTVLATGRGGSTAIEREQVGGFEIIRVPVPAGWQRHWLSVVRPGVGRDRALTAAREALRGGPGAWPRAVGSLGRAVAWLGLSIVRRLTLAIPTRIGGPGEWPPAQLYWLATWRWSTLAWADAAVRAAPASDVHHGHDLSALAAAVHGAARDAGHTVYDSHEIFVDSGRNSERPRWARAILRRLERGWGRRLAALIAVNPAQAAVIARRVQAPRIAVIHNCPPTWHGEADDRLRLAAGVPAGAPIVLYHGSFTRERGLDELAEAMLEPALADAHLVYLGFGGYRAMLDAIAADSRFNGRVHVLDAVPPDDLMTWIGGADVNAIPLQRSTLNHVLATPNKLFESIAAGVPVVVSDLPEMRRIVLDDPDGPLGDVFWPVSPAAIAAAIREILDRPADERARLRARCRAAAAARWNWETESRALVGLYAELTAPEP